MNNLIILKISPSHMNTRTPLKACPSAVVSQGLSKKSSEVGCDMLTGKSKITQMGTVQDLLRHMGAEIHTNTHRCP